MGTASGIANLTTSILANLDEGERKTLIFSDNRQDTAYQAGYIEDHHRQFTIRQFVTSLVRTSGHSSGYSFDKVVDEIHDQAIKYKILIEPRNQYEMEQQRTELFVMILNEFSRRRERRVNLEGLGLVSVEYYKLSTYIDDPYITSMAQKSGLKNEEILNLLHLFLDMFRFNRSLNHSQLTNPISWKANHPWKSFYNKGIIYRGETTPYGYVIEVEDADEIGGVYIVKTLIHTRYRSYYQAYLRKIVSREMTDDLIRDFVSFLRNKKYLLETRIGTSSTNKLSLMADYQSIELKQPENLFQCNSCLHVYPLHVKNQCVSWNCKGNLIEFSPKMDNFYVNFYTNRDPLIIQAREHSGQIDDLDKQEIENQFIKGDVNVIVCTPTLELGVDIGDLVSLIMRNVPPSPSNYAQRAGRAGRRERIATIVTYARNSPHDSYFYQNPIDMISGVIKPPTIQIDNPEILKRHINSIILESVDEKLPVAMSLLTDQEIEYKPSVDTFIKSVNSIKSKLIDQIYSTLNDEGIPWFSQVIVENFVNEFESEFRQSIQQWRRRLIDAYNELDQLPRVVKNKTQKRRRHQLEQLIGALEEEHYNPESSVNIYTQSVLGEYGMFPRYGFYGQQAYLDRSMDGKFNLLTRPMQIAIREFAPGNYIYADRNVFRVNRINLGWVESEDNSGYKSIETEGRLCQNCGDFELSSSLMMCESCSNELESLTFIKARYFSASKVGSINAEAELRRRMGYKMTQHYSPKSLQVIDAERNTWKYQTDNNELTVTFQQRATITTINHGYAREDEQFYVCPICGYIPRYSDGELLHSVGSTCDGVFEVIKLGTVVNTDALEIHFTKEYTPEQIVTLRTALLTGARVWLEAENMEINGFEPAFKEDLIVLYENSTGSVGYLKQVSNELNQVAKFASKVLEDCECIQSCYNCLRHYRNQSEHPLLNKIDVIPILKELSRSKATLSDTTSPGGSGGIKTPEVDPCAKTESPIEKILCEEIVRSSMKLPKLQWVIQDKDGVPICRPDFTWKSHKLAVFCDGDEFHSPQKAPEQYQKDIEIQNRLITMSWQVLRFTGKQINSDVTSCVDLIQTIIG